MDLELFFGKDEKKLNMPGGRFTVLVQISIKVSSNPMGCGLVISYL